MAKNKVTIVIPVYNEKNYIEKIIKKITKDIKFNKQIIVVDDYSTDGTRKKIKKIKKIDKIIFHKKNQGKELQLNQLFLLLREILLQFKMLILNIIPKI